MNIKTPKFEYIRGHIFKNCFNKNSIIVDLGANEGEFSKKFIKKYPYSKMILIEANPYLIQKLRSRFKPHKCQIFHAFLGNKSKRVIKFYLSNKSTRSSMYQSFSKFEVGLKKKIEVKTITLDDIFKIFRIQKIDLIKMDIEGAEWNVLKNFSKTNFKRIKQISVEFHDFLKPSKKKETKACILKLKKLGYFTYQKGSCYLFYRD